MHNGSQEFDMMCREERSESDWQHVPQRPNTPATTHHQGTLGRRAPPPTNMCPMLSDTHFSSNQTCPVVVLLEKTDTRMQNMTSISLEDREIQADVHKDSQKAKKIKLN